MQPLILLLKSYKRYLFLIMKNFLNKITFPFWIIVCVSIWLALWYFVNTFLPAERGSFGDQFGFQNSLFAALGLAGIIYAIILQQREFKLTRREFESNNILTIIFKQTDIARDIIKEVEYGNNLNGLSALNYLYNSSPVQNPKSDRELKRNVLLQMQPKSTFVRLLSTKNLLPLIDFTIISNQIIHETLKNSSLELIDVKNYLQIFKANMLNDKYYQALIESSEVLYLNNTFQNKFEARDYDIEKFELLRNGLLTLQPYLTTTKNNKFDTLLKDK